jgi:putative PIN family toxin of toxin-antitoxin system
MHTLVTSVPILSEFREKLTGKLRIDGRLADAAAELLQSRMRIVEPLPLAEPACRDPDDDVVIATAAAGSCDCIITGDQDLLTLHAPTVPGRGAAALEPGAGARVLPCLGYDRVSHVRCAERRRDMKAAG